MASPSSFGAKAWHFHFTWGGKRDRLSFGAYPALSLKDARTLRDEARALLAKGVNAERKRHAIILAGEHTFKAVYDPWLTHRKLSLDEGRQTSLEQIGRVFKNDVFPVLRHLTIYGITRAHLLARSGYPVDRSWNSFWRSRDDATASSPRS